MSIIGGIASALIGKSSADKAAAQASQGFNYLKDNEFVQGAQDRGGLASANIAALLGLGGDEAAAQEAFRQYQGSTGYQFRLGQGISAIEQSGAARGLLNSGATMKALNEYGQGLASSEFQNYLAALGGMESTGLGAAYNVASQGTSAGQAAAQYTRAGAADMMGGLGSALQGFSTYRASQPSSNSGAWYNY